MPRKQTVIKAPDNSGAPPPLPDQTKIGRPSVEEIAADEEIRADQKNREGEDKPEQGKKPDARPRCEHGRIFKCEKCDGKKAVLTPEQQEKRREKLENVVGQFYESAFNIVALIAGQETFRLKKEERHGLSTTGATTVEEIVPETSIKAIAVVAHLVTVAGVITGKVWDAQKEAELKKAGKLPVTPSEVKADGEHTEGNHRDKKDGEVNPRPGLLRIP